MTDIPPNRTLTDDDIAALYEKVRDNLMSDIYKSMGKGLVSFLVKVFFSAAIALAAYGGWTEHTK